MGLRDRLNQKGGVIAGVAAAVIVLAGVFMVHAMTKRSSYPDKLPNSFFSVDDGKTFFVANSVNIPPFDYNGKPAVHAYVYECNGKRFVGFLERYRPEARDKIVAQKYSSPEFETYGRELKKPGDANWTKASDAAAVARITNVKCPDGNGTPEPVEP
jgi:hypothetical protein